MKTLKVNLSQNSYEIRLGSGILNQVGDYLKNLGFKSKAVIITNPIVKGLYGNSLKANLDASGFHTMVLEVPDGEDYKSLDQAGKLYDQLGDFQAERMTPVLALGGGVIGDLAGFVAATYMRGVPLVQLPTTLLAQVDSSIGGKVAVDHGQLKNNIGAFYQPKLVISDISTLKTLPEEEFQNGLAETIKYGIIRDPGLFRLIEYNRHYHARNEKLLEDIVFRSASIKVEIVEKDERDLGLRNILNYGHTVGHALEIVSNYQIKHGRAVAIGMVAEGMISQSMGILSQTELKKIISSISGAGLPVKIRNLAIETIIQAMQHDKKKAEGKVKFILPKTIGEVIISDEVSTSLVEQVLRELI